MMNIKRVLTTLLTVSLGFSPAARAAFEDLGVGARAPGMANAFVGIADDVNALHYNPAGLGYIGERELTTEYSQLLRGTDDGSEIGTTYLGYVQPIRGGSKGTVGLGYHNFKAESLLSERTLYLSYGRKLNINPFNWTGDWTGGFTIKHLHREFEADEFSRNALNSAGLASDRADPLFDQNGFSNNNFALDIGALYKFGPRFMYRAGLTFVNVNQPDVSLAGDDDKAPFATKLGLSAKPRWGLLTAEVRRVKRLQSKTDSEIALGVERRFALRDWGAFSLRGGYAEGSREFKKVTIGGSYEFGKARLDYAFNFPIGNLSDTSGSHRLGFSIKLGKQLVIEQKEIIYKDRPVEKPQVEQPNELPEAPQVLKAPTPVIKSTEPKVSDFDLLLREFGERLGEYFTEKEAGASLEKREAMLNAINKDFGQKGIDLSLVHKELVLVGELLERKAQFKALSKKKKTKEVAPKQPAAPALPSSTKSGAALPPPPVAEKAPVTEETELQRSWRLYQQSINRGITDYEKIELLEAILENFSGPETKSIENALNSIRKRVQE